MGNNVKLSRKSSNFNRQIKNNSKGFYILSGFVILILAAFFFTQQGGIEEGKVEQFAKLEGDLKILKSEITSEAKYYPFNLDGVNMEVIALKAQDGTIRTALNTCQVCFDSGKGYYIQDTNTKALVCQNCGNRFSPENVEIIKGGCNPVPIMAVNKTDDGTNITIDRNILKESQYLFKGWSKG